MRFVPHATYPCSLGAQTLGLSQSISKANEFYRTSVLIGYLAGTTAVTIIFSLVWYTASSIVNRINVMVSSLRDIAVGASDLSVRIKLSGKDEMTELAHWFNTFIARLESVVNRSTEEIRKIAYTDNLSGLPNRRMLIECLNAEKKRCAENPGRQVAGMFLDLDNFKPINDQLGHDAGDELIRQVAERLCAIVGCRESRDDMDFQAMLDGKKAMVARIGGDEFFMMVPGEIDYAGLEAMAQRIIKTILDPYTISGEQCRIGVSIGISTLEHGSDHSANLMDQADLAMYEAKNSGKNTHRFYSQEISDEAKRKVRLESALRSSIDKDELKLLYQPKFDLNTGKYIGAEALLRWHGDEFGFMTPDQFIPCAEKSGFIVSIDQWVLSQSCRKINQWRSKGIDPGRLAINLSPHLVRGPTCISLIDEVMQRYYIHPDQLEFEVTELSANGFMEEVGENLRRLRDKQLRVAMDDFGVGQSSMRMLIGCEIDALKLDRSLVDKLETDKRTQVVVKSLLSMARSLNVTTVAEGVERKSQVNLLKALGCDTAQGYYFAKPMSDDELEAFMSSRDDSDRRIA